MLRTAADQGCQEAQYDLVVSYHQGTNGCICDFERTYEYAAKYGSQGNMKCLNYQGDLLRDGIGCTKNVNKSFECYKKAAQNENPLGQYNVGNCYVEGIGCEKNLNESFKYFKLSAENGNIDGK
jgi:TPR repeat protein